LLTLGKTKECS